MIHLEWSGPRGQRTYCGRCERDDRATFSILQTTCVRCLTLLAEHGELARKRVARLEDEQELERRARAWRMIHE